MRSGWRVAAVLGLVSIGLLGVETSAAKTVWLCKPGLEANPCTPDQSLTSFSPSLQKLSTESLGGRRPRPRFDCFYVYPTVSDQPTVQANRRIDPELRSIALYQAARFSRIAGSTRPCTGSSRSSALGARTRRRGCSPGHTALCATLGGAS